MAKSSNFAPVAARFPRETRRNSILRYGHSAEQTVCTRPHLPCRISRVLSFPGVPAGQTKPDILFYDGHCGLCHRAVKFVIKHDRSGRAFRFAPLQGETFQRELPAAQRATLPDTVVVLTREGFLLIRSDAAVYILMRLGGIWNPLGKSLGLIPRFIRDAGYNFIARVRYRVFGRRQEVCPVAPLALRARFDP